MILLPDAAGKTYAVLGLGKSGRATVASLLASGADVVAWDDSEKARLAIAHEFPAAHIRPVKTWNFAALSALAMSPGIMLSHEAAVTAKKHNVEIIGDIELLWRAQAPKGCMFIGITGTNGKSTTTSLIAHILKTCGERVEVGGNLGTPALALMPLKQNEIYVLELSSYQLDLVTTTQFHIAVLLNISPDHLDHHGSMENYIAAKCHIYDRQRPPESGTAYVAIIGVDDEDSLAIVRRLQHSRGSVIPISATEKLEHGISVQNAVLYDAVFCDDEDSPQGANSRGSIAAINALQGQHNWQNAAAAYAVCRERGLGAHEIIAAMATYPGLAHRMQWLGEIGGVQFVNDSKATNADAAEKALKTYDGIYWILGGVAKEGGIDSLAPYFPKVRHAYVIGEAAAMFAKTLEGRVPYTQCGTLENAFTQAATAAMRDVQTTASAHNVVLAPACASFDQFANFEARGEAFVALYEQLKREHAA